MSRRHQRRFNRRLLSMETLEGRRLLVVGPVGLEVPPQNFANPEDSNNDGAITPMDALLVINELNNDQPSGSPKSYSTDVDGDGIVSPRDALLIINRLNSHSDTSGVSPQQRAIGLRKSLDAGVVPPRMTRADAQELLETLENGGHYEAGERYRNGRLLNINEPADDSDGAVAQAESEAVDSTLQSDVLEMTETAELEIIAPQSIEENDPLALFDSADETLSESLDDLATWRAMFETRIVDHREVVDRLATRLSEQLAERLASTQARERLAQTIADAIQIGEDTARNIADEIATIRATLGNAHSEVAQLFANVDIEGIVERFSLDLGTLAEAVLSHDPSDAPDREAVFAAFLSREYFTGLGEVTAE